MRTRSKSNISSILAAVFLCSAFASHASAGTWKIGVVDEDGDVGKYCELQTDGLGNLYAVYFRDDLDILMAVTGSDTLWQAPEKVDSSGGVDGYCAIAVTDDEVRRITYRRDDTGALWYAGPEPVDVWEIGTVISSADDVGGYCSALAQADGEVSLSCRNTTEGSLLFMVRDSFGVWSAPQTVDPGPDRGRYCDHAFRPAAGYAFSEYDGGNGMLLFADPVMHGRSWMIGTIREQGDAGAYVSSCLAPDDRIASAFYHYNSAVLGCVYISALNSGGGSIVKAVVDSIANSYSAGVYIDVAVTPDWDWHISYRNPIDQTLCYAYADDYILVGIEEDGENPYAPAALLRLDQNAPNPFNPFTRITYSVPAGGHVRLAVYDVTGRLVETLVEGPRLAGTHTVIWDAKDDRGREVASGVYFLRLFHAGQVRTRKLVLLR